MNTDKRDFGDKRRLFIKKIGVHLCLHLHLPQVQVSVVSGDY